MVLFIFTREYAAVRGWFCFVAHFCGLFTMLHGVWRSAHFRAGDVALQESISQAQGQPPTLPLIVVHLFREELMAAAVDDFQVMLVLQG